MRTIIKAWKLSIGERSDVLKCYIAIIGSGALSGKMLLVRIVENIKIDDYLGQVRLSKG